MATTPTPRPVPTQEDRMRDARTDQPRTFATYLDRTERDQLDAKAACAQQERDEALDDRDAYKEARDVAQQLATFRQGVIDDLNAETMVLNDTIRTQAAEMGAAGDVLAVVRDAVERIDRALATYDTQQQQHVSVLGWCITCGSKCPNGRCPNDASPRLGSPSPRAQDDSGTVGYEIVARALHRDGLGALVSGDVVASAVSTRPTLAEAVDELRRAIGPAEREG